MVVHLDLSCASSSHETPSKPSVASTRKQLHALSLAVAKSKRVVVVTGAGISCSSGIPDFRSSDGLYALVKSKYPNVVLKGKDLFSAGLFRETESTQLFYTFIAQLKTMIDKAHPGATHRFLKTLDNKGRLLRSYTQNIDGFEEMAGLGGVANAKGKGKKFSVKETKNVQLHGDIHAVRCVICSASLPCTQALLASFLEGIPPDCPECSARSDARLARNARPLAVGSLRPAIVLYDEPHPLGEEIGLLCSSDLGKKPDMLIVMGTSLKVHGIKRLVKDFANAVHGLPEKASSSTDVESPSTLSSPSKLAPRPSQSQPLLTNKKPRVVIFVNRTPPPPELAHLFDYWVQGETDDWVQRVEADWKGARPQDWEVQSTLLGGGLPLHPLKEAEKNVFNVVKGGKGGKPIPIPLKSPGSENAHPGHITLSTLPHHRGVKTQKSLPALPKIRIPARPAAAASVKDASTSQPATTNASRPVVGRPKLKLQTSHSLPSSSTTFPPKAKAIASTSAIPIASQHDDVRRSPKKKKLSDGSGRYVPVVRPSTPIAATDDEDEDPIPTMNLSSSPVRRGLLFGFGSGRGSTGMGIDGSVHGAFLSSSQETAVSSQATLPSSQSTVPSSQQTLADDSPEPMILSPPRARYATQRPPLRAGRGEYDMSLDIDAFDDVFGSDDLTPPPPEVLPVVDGLDVEVLGAEAGKSTRTMSRTMSRTRSGGVGLGAGAKKVPKGGVVKRKAMTMTKSLPAAVPVPA